MLAAQKQQNADAGALCKGHVLFDGRSADFDNVRRGTGYHDSFCATVPQTARTGRSGQII